MLAVANAPRFASVPPARIVPMLADEGIYLASESTFSRVLRAQGQTAHRGRAKAPKAAPPPTTHISALANRVVTEIKALVRPDHPGIARAWVTFGYRPKRASENAWACFGR